VIHVVDANYGRLDNSMCADQLGTPNDNCRQDATCVVRKWFASGTSLWILEKAERVTIMPLFCEIVTMCKTGGIR